MNQRTTWVWALAAGGLAAVLLAGVIVGPRGLYPPLSAADLHGVLSAQARIQLQQAQSQLANDARSSILQAFGGLLVVVGAVATWRQVHITREGQITDRFTRAIDQVGSDNRDVRIGGIYALGRIAANSPDDRSTVQYVLGAFVRDHASWPAGRQADPEHPTATVDKNFPPLTARAPDIHAAVSLLARRPPSRDASVLYLSRTDLRGFHYDDARMEETQIRHANLARASLRRARLDRADLSDTDLRGADLEGAHLGGAKLYGTYLQEANLHRADLRYADLRNADLRGTDLSATFLEATLMTGAHADPSTVWPAEFDAARRNELGIIEADPDGPAQTAAATA